ncbi:cryptochrome/photolyase family protein [Micavibrio aeruginosavorus]|uniref:Protein related to deoxyribodipyrimidine photolyase n=1 Tax=Micavibrio aeruginosavorus EPB TaxID=349215 RepID=M4VH40_9BACT|nr:cryptochrome/photolyase family protein [Micavibrio aeruginosavorus]AGH98702.1 Protein related to deoxyribodipyrimidine photolyase [Micavibrio aeruginosavorus EPB]
MTTLRLVLGDQLSTTLSSLDDCADGDVILMCEVMEEATYVRHHPKKIAFLFSAMRHFAQELVEKGYRVVYVSLDDPENTGSLKGEVSRILHRERAKRIVITEPGEYRLLKDFESWHTELGVPVDIRPDTRFLCGISEFSQWAEGRKQLRMEYFYRVMRKKYNILIDENGEPTGGQWNFDKENRKSPPRGLFSPRRISHAKDEITRNVLSLVKERFSNHFGHLEPFHYAINREQALIELDHFITKLLPHFGDYQDCMVSGEPYLYHSLISSYLNAGLLLPLEICRQAEAAYLSGHVPLNAAEGFIRQILGWREYVRGVYWLHMPEYGEMNYFNACEPLPDFYWTADTKMTCVREAVCHTRDHAYSHHIQRLMVTGNFALLAGLDVRQVQEWYLAVYSDAYEWVEMPNTLGMALFGDGGIMGSKPYAASGKYINKMSNFCTRCAYDVNDMTGPRACPFNALYWDFMARNEAKLRPNHRLPYVYATWDKFSPEKKQAIREKAQSILRDMRDNAL